jgi:hypothetical protein
MFKYWFIIGILVVVLAGFAFAQLEFEGRYWFPELTAKAKLSEGGLAGTDIDLISDLGFDDKNAPEGRLTWDTGPRNKFRIAYTQFHYCGDQNITRTVVFDGEIYSIGTRVVSDLKIQYARAGWIWYFIDNDRGKFKLGTILEAKGIWLKAKLDAPDNVPPIAQEEKVTVGLPTIGAAMELNPTPMVNIFAEASGLPAGDYGYCLDAEAGLKLAPVKNFTIFGGYRYLDVKGEKKDNDDYVKATLKGPFAGATIRF